jgi:bifunctional DNase/RNase
VLALTDGDGFQEMQLVGVRVEMPSNSPIALLKEAHGDRYLPIWIGAVEATAIAFAQQGMVSVRPLTHDLFRDVLEAVNIRLLSARITSLGQWNILYGSGAFEREQCERPAIRCCGACYPYRRCD